MSVHTNLFKAAQFIYEAQREARSPEISEVALVFPSETARLRFLSALGNGLEPVLRHPGAMSEMMKTGRVTLGGVEFVFRTTEQS